MAGLNIEFFNDFMSATGSLIITSPRQMVNEAVFHTNLLTRFLRDKEYAKVVQGGSEIKDQIFFDEQNTSEFFEPGERQEYVSPQVIDEHSIPWRFKRDHKAWNESELILNSGGNTNMGDGGFQQFVDLKYKLDLRLWTSWCKGEEIDLHRLPISSQMERTTSTKGKVSYSLLAFNNEYADGLAFKGFTTGQTAWTTVMGVDPTDADVNGKFTPFQSTYAQLPPEGTGAQNDGWDLWTAMDEAVISTRFEELPMRPEFSEATSSTDFVATDKQGWLNYTKGLRYANDDLFMKQDPHYPGPVHAGAPILWVDRLDTVAFYPDQAGTGLTTANSGNANAAKNGPRYYGYNAKYMVPVYHSERYMHERPVSSHHNQPDTFAQQVVTYKNLFCRSRQRHWTVSPSADLA